MATTAALMPLESLTPQYVEGHHGSYLRRLKEAIKDPRNVNIAVTGRYGAGKSSVLDEFQAHHHKVTQRLSIATLAPGEEGESTTNRIQKEIVKQLLYGASQKVGKNSRFSKIAVLSKRRAFTQSATVVAIVAGLLYLFGWLPAIKWTGSQEPALVRIAAWASAAVLVTLVVSALRMFTYGRFSVADVSAGGAALTLTEKPESFFDKYLDEIVHYFARESKDIVIFEDLDRFEDPHIFEALRELNILLNETPERRRKRRGNWPGRALRWLLAHLGKDLPGQIAAKLPYPWDIRLLGIGVPLRFVYAVKDSVFSKIDATTATAAAAGASVDGAAGGPGDGEAGDQPNQADPVDAAAAETLRANRTKFFDIVIPLVPFISHRNARDLLLKLLTDRGITRIEPRLVNTVAQHCTDMRLMRNMCNEYLVFAERLLEPEEPNKPAPGMDESHVFALVAYKNFHLEDFENITRRDSDLDRLYALHQRMVRENIAAREARKRALLNRPEQVRTQAFEAHRLGRRLTHYAELARRGSPYNWPHLRFHAGSQEFTTADVTKYPFWAEVARARSLTILASTAETGGQKQRVTALDSDALEILFPEGLDADRWTEYDASAVETELHEIERDIPQLRRADFAQLVEMPRFKVAPEPGGTEAATPGPQTFAELLTATLKSDLARDLVRRGYIDRNFSLYAAQFYGRFTGVDVANFMVQHVQTNTMAVDYDLSREGAVANLLDEAADAGEDLVRSAAAYNIDIVNHLLVTDDPRASVVARRLVANGPDRDARTFLATYFTSDGTERGKLATLLAASRWREVFSYLVGDESVPDKARPTLVSAALSGFDPDATYDLSGSVRDFITDNYRAMAAFTQPHPDDAAAAGPLAERLDVVLGRAGVVIPELDFLESRLHKLVVAASRYELTAHNLRSALNLADDVSLDLVQPNETVYSYCLNRLQTYLATIDRDTKTGHAVNTTQTLTKVLHDLAGEWTEDHGADPDTGDVADLLARTSPRARLSSLRAVPKSTWTALAAADLFRASLANVEAYRAHVGSIDTHVAALLEREGTVHLDEREDTVDQDGAEYDRQEAAVSILNATVLAPDVRVELAASLGTSTPLPVQDIVADADHLFALLLERGMVDDDETSFEHFRGGGPAALGPAIKVSTHIETFIRPELVVGMVSEFLADAGIAAKVGRLLVENVDECVPDDVWPELKAVAEYADAQRIALEPDTIVRLARVARENGDVDTTLLLRLLCTTSPAAAADHIVDVFVQLGGPYADISRTDAKFKVDYDEIHDQLLRVLKAARRITRGTTRGKGHYTVTVL